MLFFGVTTYNNLTLTLISIMCIIIYLGINTFILHKICQQEEVRPSVSPADTSRVGGSYNGP